MGDTRVSDANVLTERYMDSILVEERLIDSVVADVSTTFLGEQFSMPVMTPAFSHLKNFAGREKNGLEEYSLAAKACNILKFLRKVGRELRYMMSFTGFAHVADIDDSVLHFL